MPRIGSFLTIPVAAALFAAGCGGGTGAQREAAPDEGAAPPTVTIDTFQYQPDPVSARAGEVVEWSNHDATVHTVTAGTREQPAKGDFDGSLGQDERFSHTFEEPGTYAYFCTRHSGPGMTGEVIVE